MKTQTQKTAKAYAAIRRAANPFRKRARVHSDRKKEAARLACRQN